MSGRFVQSRTGWVAKRADVGGTPAVSHVAPEERDTPSASSPADDTRHEETGRPMTTAISTPMLSSRLVNGFHKVNLLGQGWLFGLTFVLFAFAIRTDDDTELLVSIKAVLTVSRLVTVACATIAWVDSAMWGLKKTMALSLPGGEVVTVSTGVGRWTAWIGCVCYSVVLLSLFAVADTETDMVTAAEEEPVDASELKFGGLGSWRAAVTVRFVATLVAWVWNTTSKETRLHSV